MEPYGIIFTPVQIGYLELKNRLVFPPMVIGQAKPDGKVTDAHVDWYEARAKGGTGLIIVESTAVTPGGVSGPAVLGMWDDDQIIGYRKLIDKVHSHGAMAFLQLTHAGRQTDKMFLGGRNPIAPSAISCPMREPVTKEVPKEASIEEIEEIVESFGQAARRTQEAGFDGLEIHGGHGFLISSFMSAYSNKRHDEYGGDLDGRMQLPLKIIRRIRREVGVTYTISFRFSGDEYVPDGRTIEESKRIAPMLVKEGADCLHVTAGVHESFWSQFRPHGAREGVNADAAAAIKGVVDVPVITVGRIKSPDVAEEILEQGKADLVAIGRQLICDPEWPHKVKTKQLKEIRPCIGCTQSCINRGVVHGQPASCIYNTDAGIEKKAGIKQTKKPKKILIAGGGPGGLEAARIAALRGHEVQLCEKSSKLGGRFSLACFSPSKQEFATAIKWLSDQIHKLGVRIELNEEVTPKLVAQIKPDVLIVATGAVPSKPAIPGIHTKKVMFGEDILAGKAALGERIVILGGGGIGTEVADFLSQRHKEVTIVEKLGAIGVPTGIPLLIAQTLIPRLRLNGVKILTKSTIREITDNDIIIDVNGKGEVLKGIDQVIVAEGARSVNELAVKLGGKISELFTIGDAKEPRSAFEATQEGAEVARQI